MKRGTTGPCTPLVRYADRTAAIACPYGEVRRLITGGEGGVANVHLVRVERGEAHFHRGYDEVYWVLAGHGRIRLGDREVEVRPGAAVVIPAGTVHSLQAAEGESLEFVIFGTPPVPIEDESARPVRPEDRG